MSEPQKLTDSKEYQERAGLIDDPAMFLSLDSPHPYPEVPRNNDRVSSSISNNENEFQLGQPDEGDNKQDDGDLYEPESANFQAEEEQKENQMDEQEEQYERIPQENAIRKAASQPEPKPAFAEDFIVVKAPTRKRKKVVKKRDFDSQEDEYSGDYGSRKKGRPKDSKKSGAGGVVVKNDKRNETTRSRGKPRGRAPNPFKVQDIKRQSFLEDPVSEKGTDRFKITRRTAEIMPAMPAPIPLTFNSNWRLAQDFEQDWDSSNASMWQQSVNRRLECAVLGDIMFLVQQKVDNVIEEIARLPPVWYSTL